MLNIGCHLSSSSGFANMGKEALEIGANTFQFFTRNPRGSKAKNIDKSDVDKLLELMNKHKFAKILAHAPYTLNPCSATKATREFAYLTMKDDLERMEFTPHQLYNFHPGSHTGQGIETGIDQIITLLNAVIKEEHTSTILLETMSGKGTEVGSKFEELKKIIDGVKLKDKMGVCLDTCHISDAGYDIINNLDDVIEEFDNIIGLERLKAIHLNDSLNPIGAHKDRHACIGKGEIGIDAIKNIINHPKLKNIPFLLETPNDIQGYADEIKLLKELYLD